MLLTSVSDPTDEVSARPIVIHEEQCMLELKLLLHKQGFRIFQEGVEMVNKVKFKDLHGSYPMIREETALERNEHAWIIVASGSEEGL